MDFVKHIAAEIVDGIVTDRLLMFLVLHEIQQLVVLLGLCHLVANNQYQSHLPYFSCTTFYESFQVFSFQELDKDCSNTFTSLRHLTMNNVYMCRILLPLFF